MDGAAVEVIEVALGSPEAHLMIDQALAELDRRYGPGVDREPLEHASFSPPLGGFFVARAAGQLVGGVGLRSIAPDIGEIKRLWVDEAVRRSGVARALMEAAEAAARRLGMRLVELETGPLQPEAVNLYLDSGWTLVEQLEVPVSDYPDAVRFEKRYNDASS